MDDDGRFPGTGPAAAGGAARAGIDRVRASLRTAPPEVAGLTMLLLGGIVCLGILLWWSRPVPAPPVAAADAVPRAASDAMVTVHVTGAVVAPGVVEVPASARVVDAIAAAGGATVVADVGALNLARTVSDGERIAVPERGAPGPGPDGPDTGGGAFDAEGRLDLNGATAEELETLPGIGPVLAQRIVEHREAHGPFTSAGQLREVPGIGERSFQRLAGLVVVR